MKKAVITGATGMLGATLARELIARGVAVLAIIRPHSPKRANLPTHPLLRVLERDISQLADIGPEDAADFGEAFAPPYDLCYHFAWNGTYGASRDDLYTQNLNVRYTLDAVGMAARLGCTGFVGAGSQAEYGPVPEGQRLTADTPTHPISGYGAAKLSAGLLGRLRARQLGLRFVWARIISVYGPMDNEFTLTVSTVRKLLRGEHVAFTKGEQLWDFLYAGDAARAFRLLGEKGRDGATYVLGSGQPVRLADALTTLARAVSPDASFGLGELPYRPDQCMYLCADLSALTADTGFTPEVGYAEGVSRTIEWCRQHPQA